MKKLNKEEMKKIKAGGISAVGWAVIASLLSFAAGILDGYTRPYKCR